MSRHELNRAVAQATGESVDAIRRRGFHALDTDENDSGPRVLDWDSDGPVCLEDVLDEEPDEHQALALRESST